MFLPLFSFFFLVISSRSTFSSLLPFSPFFPSNLVFLFPFFLLSTSDIRSSDEGSMVLARSYDLLG